MLSPDQFRRIALSMDDAIEGAHMGHPDFRAHGKIFATLAPDRAWGMVKLTPEQQAKYVRDDDAAFTPASGAWGRQGSTMVRLASASEATVREAMQLAWQNSASKPRAKRAAAKNSGGKRSLASSRRRRKHE